MRLRRTARSGRRSRVVLTPRRRRQVSQRCLRGDGDKQARSPGRARNKLLKPSRAGMPGDLGATVVTNSCATYTLRTRLRVRRAPGIPHALFGRVIAAKTRAQCAAGMRRRVLMLAVMKSIRVHEIYLCHSGMRHLGAGLRCAIAHRGIHNPCGGYGFRARSLRSRPGMTSCFLSWLFEI